MVNERLICGLSRKLSPVALRASHPNNRTHRSVGYNMTARAGWCWIPRIAATIPSEEPGEPSGGLWPSDEITVRSESNTLSALLLRFEPSMRWISSVGRRQRRSTSLSAICGARTALRSGDIRSSAAILWRSGQTRSPPAIHHQRGGRENGDEGFVMHRLSSDWRQAPSRSG
jgi:hypothetical protein